jgi:hypothetical protein
VHPVLGIGYPRGRIDGGERGRFDLELDEGVDPYLSGYKSVTVDIDGLHSFAGAVDTEVEGNFRPRTVPLIDSYATGVPFGADSPSGDVHAARMKYYDCLTGVTEQLTAYVNASKILADAIRLVAKNYSDADALSEAQAKEIEGAFGSAMRAAQEAQAAADARAYQRGSMRAI